MPATWELVTTPTLLEWTRAHIEVVDVDCWGPPPGSVALIVRRLVELVGRAHERGLALPGLAPASVLVGADDTVSIAVPARPGPAADRAADLLALGGVLCALATGLDPRVSADPAGLSAQHARVTRLLAREVAGNPCAVDLAPLVLGLLEPDPGRRPAAAAVQMLLSGRAPRTGTARLRLAGGDEPR